MPMINGHEHERFYDIFSTRILFTRKHDKQKTEVDGVLDELSQLSGVAIPARQQAIHRMDTVQAYVDWRACTATQLSEVS